MPKLGKRSAAAKGSMAFVEISPAMVAAEEGRREGVDGRGSSDSSRRRFHPNQRAGPPNSEWVLPSCQLTSSMPVFFCYGLKKS